jgi:hypothetical protein
MNWTDLIQDRGRWRILVNYIYITVIGLTPGSSSKAYIYIQTVHRIHRTEHT